MSMMFLHSSSELKHPNEQVFKLLTRNGLGPLSEAISATGHEVLNGDFSIDFEYPANGDLKPAYGDVVMARPKPGGGYYPFIITEIEKPIDGVVKYHADHWSVLLSGVGVIPFKMTESDTEENGETVHHDGVTPNMIFAKLEDVNDGPLAYRIQVPLFTTSSYGGSWWPLNGASSLPTNVYDVVALRDQYYHVGNGPNWGTRPPAIIAGQRMRLIEQAETYPFWYKIEPLNQSYPNEYVNSDPAYTRLEPVYDEGEESTSQSSGFIKLTSDIDEYKPFVVESPATLRSILGDGIEGGSLLDVFEGEYSYDPITYGDTANYIRLLKNRGRKKPIMLQYGVNLSGFNLDEDYSDIYTHMIPVYVKDDGTSVIGDPIVSEKQYPITKVMMVDVSSELSDNDNPTKAQVTEAGRTVFAKEKIDELDLSLTVETDEAAVLEELDLGDIIGVYYSMYNYSAELKSTEYTSDILNDKITEIKFERRETRDKDVVSTIANSAESNSSKSKSSGSSGGGSSGGIELSNATPKMNGTASPGTAERASRSDHVHPSDTTRAPLNSPTFTGEPKAPTPAVDDNTTKLATTAFVKRAIDNASGTVTPSTTTPKMNGIASVGSENAYSRGDHVHPSDDKKQDILTFDNVPTANSNNPVKSGGIRQAIDESVLGTRGVFYGTCDTDAATAIKSVTCSDFESGDLIAGTMINVLFSHTNSAAVGNLKLNVNSTGEKSIKYIYNGSYSNVPAVGYIKANQIYKFTYDGTYWVVDLMYNTNDSAYMVYMANTRKKVYTACGRYSLCFTKDEEYLLPVNALDNDTTTTKQLTTESFDPFGDITYRNASSSLSSGSLVANNSLYIQRHAVDLRYSFNTGTTLVADKDVYIVCDPQPDGKVKLASTPIVQTLPSTADGKVYIFLGVAYDTYRVSICIRHPVYYYLDGAIRLWTNADESTNIQPSSTLPAMNGTASVGSETGYSRGDHVHPTDTTRAPLDSPTFTGEPKAPTPGNGLIFTDSSTKIATTEFVQGAIAAAGGGSSSTAFQGTISSSAPINLLRSLTAGWYWKIAVAGTYFGNECEVGDFLVVTTVNPSKVNNVWPDSVFSVVQTNIRPITDAEIDAILAS